MSMKIRLNIRNERVFKLGSRMSLRSNNDIHKAESNPSLPVSDRLGDVKNYKACSVGSLNSDVNRPEDVKQVTLLFE